MDQQAPPPDPAPAIGDAPHRPSSVDEFEAAAPVLDPAAEPVDQSPQLIDRSSMEESPSIPTGKRENDETDGLMDGTTQLLEESQPPAVSTCEDVNGETNQMDDLQPRAFIEDAHTIEQVAPSDAPEVGDVDAVNLEMEGTQRLVSRGGEEPALEWKGQADEMDASRLAEAEDNYALDPVAMDESLEGTGGVGNVQDEEGSREMEGTQHLGSPLAHLSTPTEEGGEEPVLEPAAAAGLPDDYSNDMDREDAVQLNSKAEELEEDAARRSNSKAAEDTYALDPVAMDESLEGTGGVGNVQDEEGTREMEGTQHLGSPLAHLSAPTEEGGEEPVSEPAAAAGLLDDSSNYMDREDAVQLNSKAEDLEEDAARRSNSSGRQTPAPEEDAVEMDVENTERLGEVAKRRGSRKSKGRRKPSAGEDAVGTGVEKMEEPGEECSSRGKRKGKSRRKLYLVGGSLSAANDDVAAEEDAIEMDKEETEEPAKEAARGSKGRKRRNPDAGGNSLTATGDAAVGENTVGMDMDEVEEPVNNSACGSRSGKKRGRPRRSQVMRAQPKRRQEKEDEEVCFICFDGGELVVCDRRGCPKVYHPSCVNRDEAFFRAKGRWNCGWHICSTCEKSAHFMCYTCTYSLCKGCISEVGFVRVRGDKGFCATCMGTVMMIESDNQNQKPGGIDFDDRASWMYLFKDYWVDLKIKLSLTLEELTRAQAPQKDSNAPSCAESSDDHYDANVVHEASSDSSGHFEESISRKKAKKQTRNVANEENSGRKAESEGASASEDTGWASKELLDFVAHMKDGDTSALSQFDVQALLLDYIKQNNLRDTRRKSQIVCDSMLLNLFGKDRVGHFEMLKLLESHFLMIEPSPVVTDDNQEGVVDPDPGPMDIEGNSDASTRTSSDKKRKTRKRSLEKEPQTNLDDYAAIDVHNINLMYLRRNLMEDLLDDVDTFNEKVVGSFVRIRISGTGQRQDIYRLVQIVGVGKAAKKYKSGKKATDFTLEILNLNKTEFIAIDIISNQEFTEEECKRLRQSIKCGFISRLTVGEVLEKAIVLQAARATDWLESEKLRLGNLRDRASEQGRRKQLRECVERLQLLSTPEERIRRLNEVPKIHDDPKMDPDYESSEDDDEPEDKKEDNYDHLRERVLFGKKNEGTSPGKGGSISRNNWDSAGKGVHTAWGSINMATESSWDVGTSSAINRKSDSSLNQEKVQQTTNLEAPNAHMKENSLEAGASNSNHLVMNAGQSSVVPFEGTSTCTLPGVLVSSNTGETEKIWHYQDPSGKVQGPFSMTQLRKWDSTGHFPSSLSIWRISEGQEHSILLNDALKGKFQKDLPKLEPQCNSSAQPMKFERVDVMVNNSYGGSRGNNISTSTDNNHNAEKWKARHGDDCSAGTGNVGPLRAGIQAAQASSLPTPKSEVNIRDDRSGGWQSFSNNNSWSGQSQGANSSRPMSPISGNPYRYQGRGGRGRWHGGQDRQNNWNQNKTRGIQPGSHAYERQQPSWSRKTSGGQWNNQPVDNPSNQVINNSFILPDLPPSSMGLVAVQGAFMNSSTNTPVQLIGSVWGPTPRSSGVEVPPVVTMGASITAPVTNPVGCWSVCSSPSLSMQVRNSLANVSAPVPNSSRMTEFADSVQTLGYCEQKKHSEFAAPVVSEGVQLSPGDENVSVKIVSALDCSASTEFRSSMNADQSSASACPIQSPTCKQGAGNVQPFCQSTQMQGRSVSLSNEPDPIKNNSEGSGRPCAENGMTSAIGIALNPGATSLNTVYNPQANSAASEACQPLNAHNFSAADIKPAVVSDTVSIVPVQGSEASTFTHRLDGSSDNLSASAANVCESNQALRPEVNISVSIPAGSENREIPSENRSFQWMKSSLTEAPNLLVNAASAAPYPTNGPNDHLISTVGSQPPQLNVNINTVHEQPSMSRPGAAQQISSLDTGTAQASNNMILGTALQGSANTGWGVVRQGDMDVVWGVPAQGNPNLAIGWGTAVQGDMNMDMPWGIPAQGNASTNAVWMALPQGNTSANLNWGTPAHGTVNPTGCPAPVMNQNIGWGVVAQTNANTNWGAQQGNINPTWNSNSLNTQQNQTTDRPGQSDAAFDGSNSAHGPGRRLWNSFHSDGREGPSRPPREKGGVCKYHESGYCKKGAQCNYIHMR